MSAMREPVGSLQRVLEPSWRLNLHMSELASRYGSVMPRGQNDGIVGPKRASTPTRLGGPYVAIGPIRELLRPVVEMYGTGRVAFWAGKSERSIARIMYGNSERLTVTLADELICHVLGDPGLWGTPGLEYVNVKGERWTI